MRKIRRRRWFATVGHLIFFGSYFVFALGKFPWMKIIPNDVRQRTR